MAGTEGECKVSEGWKSRTTGYRQFPADSELLSYSTGEILALDWGTLHRTIGTKDAAIAGFGAEQRGQTPAAAVQQASMP